MSRWVCQRCFAANDDTVPACSQCGLLRGATPAEGDSWQPATAEPAAQPSSLRRFLPFALRFWWLGAIVVVAVAGFIFNAQRGDAGEITRSGNLQVSDLRVGDCFSLKDQSQEAVEEVQAQPCSEAHHYEVFYAADMPDGSYPSDDAIFSWVGDNCVGQFGGYVGAAYGVSQYDIGIFQPTPDGWSSGDHEVSCVITDPNDAQLTGAARNAAR